MAAFAGNVYVGGGAPVGGTAAVWNFQTVAYTQASAGAQVTVTGTTVGAAVNNNQVSNRLGVAQGASGALGSQVPVMTTAATAGTGYVTNAFSRRVLSDALSTVFDFGGLPTNIVMSPGLRAVFTEVLSRAGVYDNYRINYDSNSEITNTTSVFVTDFGFRLRVDTEQQLRNYTSASGGSPATVPLLGNCPDATRFIAF